MKLLRSLVASAAVIVLSTAPAAAELCAIDAVPAATILVPYFEVNFDNAGRSKFEHTKVTLVNADAAPAIAHVILWTDLSVPTLNFDIFLTGFDKLEFDVDALFTHGALPIPAGQGTNGTTGCTSCDESGCTNISPGDDFTLTDLINAHTGRSVGFYSGQCMGRRLGGNVARGYITIDNANQCSRLVPGDSGYFENGGNGVANNRNALKATITTFSKKFLREVPAIHIEAGTSSGLSTEGNFTFYGRYNGYDASDNRECGAFGWGFPWERRDKFKTDAIVWRDSGIAQGPFDCSEGPEWFPIDTTQIVVFDDQENAIELNGDPAFPAETQLVEVGRRPLNTGSFDSGWLFVSLADGSSGNGASNGDAGHGYVIARQRLRSREGDAWAQAFFATLCGEQVSDAVRARARLSMAARAGKSKTGASDVGKKGGSGKKIRRIELDEIPRPPSRPE